MNTNLYGKLVKIMSQIGWIEKGSTVDMGRTKYDYVSEAQFIAEVRPLLIENSVLVLPVQVDNLTVTEKQGEKSSSYITTFSMRYRVVDAESGEYIDLEMPGQGADATDKGAYKTLTGILKYLFRQMFLIGTGDDPEATDDRGSRVSNKKPNNYSKSKATSKPAVKKKSEPDDSQKAINSAKSHVTKMFEENVAGGLEEHVDVWEEFGIDYTSEAALPDDMPTLRAMYEFGNDLHNEVEYAEALDNFKKKVSD